MKWISIKDRLPLDEYTEDERQSLSAACLVRIWDYDDLDDALHKVIYDYYGRQGGELSGWCYHGDAQSPFADKITHWMYVEDIPEPEGECHGGK